MPKPVKLPCSAMQAYEALSLPVWLFSVDTLQILASNSAAQTWLGYDAQTLQAMSIADLRPEEEKARIVEQVRRFSGQETDAGTWTIIANSGDRYTTSFSWRRVMFDGTEAIVSSIRDMTQVIQAQSQAMAMNAEVESLRRKVALSHQQLSTIVDMLPGKMLVLTPIEHEIVAVTDEYAQAVMMERNALMGRKLFEVFPDDPDESGADGASNLRASLQRVETLRVTDVMNLQRYPVRKPDGTFEERFWLPRNKPVLDDEGAVTFIVLQVEDVTKLMDGSRSELESIPQVARARTALLALEEREMRLGIAERLLDLGAWEYDLEREKLSWSDRVFDIYGVPHSKSSPSLDEYVALVHPDDQAEMLSAYEHFAQTGAPEIEFQHRVMRYDGSVSHVRGVGVRHRVQEGEIVVGFVQDITRYKKIEDELLLAARRRRLSAHLTSLGSWRVDLGDTHITWCEETAAIHDEPEGTSPTLDEAIDYYIPEHRERIRAKFEACAREGQPFDEILQIVSAKGRRVWVRALGEAICNAADQIIAVEGAFQDITDLIAVRSKAEALAERLHQTLENISDAFFLLDQEWRFSFLNSQAERVLERRREDLTGKSVWQEFPEAVGSTFQREYERAVTNGHAVQFEEFFPPLDTWFEVNAYPTPEGLAVYFRDVTQRRKDDQKLRLLETAISRQNDILLITEAEPINDPDGPRIVFVNEAFERRTGYSKEEVLGKTPRILQGPKTQRQELDRMRQELENWRPVRTELINYTKSGEEFWLELDIVPLADDTGRFTHWVSIERDITERKHTEEALARNEERFRLIARATGNAIWEWDIARGTLWWSEGMLEIFGHEPDPSGVTPTIWRSQIHPDDEGRVDAALDRLRLGQQDIMHEQYRFRRADDSWADVEDRAFVVRDSNGEVTRVLGSMTDISERVHLEDRLRHAHKMEAVGQLTGGIAHDFNNLLTIMMGNAELLEERLGNQPQLKELAYATINAAERGAELTSRLLAFSRKQPLEPRVLDIGKLVQGMDGMLRRTLPETIDVEIVRSGGLWQIEVDAGQIESALLNLVLNARDAMPDGGNLTIETANAALDDDYVAREHGLKAGQYVLIVVTDTGHGIPPEMLDHVFEPFFTTKQTGMGSGLGLSMVYGFVKQSKGHIRVYSELGEGTSFKLYFPRAMAKAEETGPYRLSQKAAGGSETVLVVEDDESVRAHVIAQLKGLGYRILDAPSGSEALEILKQDVGIDLLFTDVVMPGGMSGSELAKAARTLRPDLKVLFTSGYTENSIVHDGRLDSGVDLLSKPYRREQLAAKVRKVLDKE